MIFAGEYTSLSGVILNDGICSMSADVMESIDVALPVLDQKERKASLSDADEIACINKAKFVGDENPLLAEDGSPLQLVHCWRVIPRCW